MTVLAADVGVDNTSQPSSSSWFIFNSFVWVQAKKSRRTIKLRCQFLFIQTDEAISNHF